ncbi:helix-turn-helix transcriptional regulator [Bacillus atrophaeus]|uniref:helix-turn-helix transcriptional regulator n=1 Tax=Bacillus atrophaeus TaxID=1452 RepID=UPI002E1BD1A5|nr:helix-turn-helix transcriptional regulator [Bacillus atrophaeus]
MTNVSQLQEQKPYKTGVKTNLNKVFCREKLKDARETRGLSIRELAEEIGLRTHQALSKYGNGSK